VSVSKTGAGLGGRVRHFGGTARTISDGQVSVFATLCGDAVLQIGFCVAVAATASRQRRFRWPSYFLLQTTNRKVNHFATVAVTIFYPLKV